MILNERIYHPYTLWEERNANMWGTVDDREGYLKQAIDFTGDCQRYGVHMLAVTDEWKYSCEHNLSNITQNRRAWIGHAACAHAFGCPEDIVRQAWGHLTEQQQINANAAADHAIKHWELNHAKEKIRGKRAGSSRGKDCGDVRFVQTCLPFFLGGEGFNGDDSFGSEGSTNARA